MSLSYRGFKGIREADRVYQLVQKVADSSISEPVEEMVSHSRSGRRYPLSFSRVACRFLDNQIGDDEIVWAGQPDARKYARKFWPIIAMAVLVLTGGIVIVSLSKNLSFIALIVPALFALFFCLIYFWQARKGAFLYYLIAGEKAVIVNEADSIMRFRLLTVDQFRSATIKEKSDGSGDIVFDKTRERTEQGTGAKLNDGDGSFEMSGFYCIDDVRQVYQLICNAKRGL